MYIINLKGDIAEEKINEVFKTKEDAVKYIADKLWPDLEDDFIEIEEITEKERKIVWQFAGWHFENKGYDCTIEGISIYEILKQHDNDENCFYANSMSDIIKIIKEK